MTHQRLPRLFAALLTAVWLCPAAAAGTTPPAAPAAEEAAAVSWLRAAGHSFDPADYGHDTLSPLVARLGGATVIGLGEATHGSHEDQAFKAALIKALVQAGQISVVMFEANRSAAAGFDRYVRTGQGQLERLMRGPALGASLQHQPVADLLEWLRRWNRQVPVPVRIIGLDCQDAGRDAQFALDFIARHDRRGASRLRASLGPLLPVPERVPGRFLDWFAHQPLARQNSTALAVDHLHAWFAQAPREWEQSAGFAEARQAARMAVQGFAVVATFRQADHAQAAAGPDFSQRDRFMAENALSQLAPAERAVLWAHDSHVIDTLPPSWRDQGYISLGMLLERQLGDRYRTLGFTWSQGRFWISPLADASLWQIVAPPSAIVLPFSNQRPGDYGALFNQTGAAAMWVDFARRPRNPVLDRWAQQPYWRGWAGWGLVPAQWQQPDPARGAVPAEAGTGFDLLVWFRELSPARRWPALPAQN